MAVTVAVCKIFSVKEWHDLENQVRSRSKTLKMAPFDRPYATFYWSAIVNIAQSCSGGARTSRQPGHFHVSTVVRQVISCELCEGLKVKISVSQGTSQGASQGRSFLARAFDLARPGVAPPLLSCTIFEFFDVE